MCPFILLSAHNWSPTPRYANIQTPSEFFLSVARGAGHVDIYTAHTRHAPPWHPDENILKTLGYETPKT